MRTRIRKAVLLLDRGESAEAKRLLVEAIAEADETDDTVGLIQALVVLGDCLHAEGDSSAGDVHLARALTIDVGDADDLVAYELSRARELLGRDAD